MNDFRLFVVLHRCRCKCRDMCTEMKRNVIRQKRKWPKNDKASRPKKTTTAIIFSKYAIFNIYPSPKSDLQHLCMIASTGSNRFMFAPDGHGKWWIWLEKNRTTTRTTTTSSVTDVSTEGLPCSLETRYTDIHILSHTISVLKHPENNYCTLETVNSINTTVCANLTVGVCWNFFIFKLHNFQSYTLACDEKKTPCI